MKYDPALEQLKNRFLVFIQKLKAKAKELQEETAASAQIIYDEDDDRFKRGYLKFKAGIEGQFNKIIEKARGVYDTQIMPERDLDAYDFSMSAAWYSEMSNYMNNFENEIRQMMNQIFDNVQEISPEVDLQAILEEYEEVKDAFHCKQCGGNLTIDQMYFVSTYITCPYCQTQNTFVPGSRMKELQHLSRDIAIERLKPLAHQLEQVRHEGGDEKTQKLLYNYYRAMIWAERSKIVPVFKDEYAKVYFCEVFEDVTRHSQAPLKENPTLYQALAEQFGFVQEIKPLVLQAYQQKDKEQFKQWLITWEMLSELSAITLPKFYIGKEWEEIHNQNFKRIQEQWALLSEQNQGLESGNITVEEAMKAIENKI